jgi:ADP-heptose:LPS heptosyltransferase
MTNRFESFERFVRRRFTYPLLRMLFHNREIQEPIDPASVKRVLIFRYDRIGDMIVTTPILRALKQWNPEMEVDVLASRSNADIIWENPWVDHVLILESNWFRLLRQVIMLRRRRYDVILNYIFNRTTGPGILANLIAPKGRKVGQGPERYAFYFNRLVPIRRFEQHMLCSYAAMAEETFGQSLDLLDSGYEIYVADDIRNGVDNWLTQHSLRRSAHLDSTGSPYIVVNTSAKESYRSLGVEQVARLAKQLSQRQNYEVVVLEPPDDPQIRAALSTRPEFRNSIIYRTFTKRPLHELASIIEGALLVISPDTSIVHFASAMRKPVLSICARIDASQEWLPRNVPYEIVWTEQRQQVSEIPPDVVAERAAIFIGRMLNATDSPMPEAK